MAREEYSVERIADRMEITDQLHIFCRGFDRRDWDMALGTYHDGAIDNHGSYNGTAVGFIEHSKKRHEHVLLSMHRVSNILIEFNGNDSALVESYVLAWQTLGPGNKDLRAELEKEGRIGVDEPLETLILLRYVDQFLRKNGAWKVQHRQLIFESSMRIPSESSGPRQDKGIRVMGKRDETDYLRVMRAELFGKA
jgi:hypothetical protein